MNFFSILSFAVSVLIISTNPAFSQISKSTFKGALDKNSPIFEIQKPESNEQLSAGVGGKLLTRTASFKNIKPDSNLLKVPTLVFDVIVKSIDNDELILEAHTYSPNVPDNILPTRYNIPLPLSEEKIIELELLPIMKLQYKKAKALAKIFPTMELKISAVTTDSVTAKVMKESETWGFGIDAYKNTLVIDNDRHTYYNVPGYKIEIEE